MGKDNAFRTVPRTRLSGSTWPFTQPLDALTQGRRA
jgi:hypothetical protein